jgi:hypothetical protein
MPKPPSGKQKRLISAILIEGALPAEKPSARQWRALSLYLTVA